MSLKQNVTKTEMPFKILAVVTVVAIVTIVMKVTTVLIGTIVMIVKVNLKHHKKLNVTKNKM